jgi:hypothetical protein
MRKLAMAALAMAFTGCTTVKLAQRDGCWVKRTSRFGSVHEELGPCLKPPPKWADDRITRIVQECVAQDDHRWEARAVAAWSRGEALPDRAAPESVLHACMEESARAALSENEGLQARLADVKADRERLAARADDDRQHLLASHDKLATDLGDAAKKPLPPLSATATASGEGRSEGTSPPSPVTVVSAGAPACGAPDAPASAPASAAAAPPGTRGAPAVAHARHPARPTSRASAPPACPPAAPVAQTAAPAEPAPAEVVKEAAAPAPKPAR